MTCVKAFRKDIIALFKEDGFHHHRKKDYHQSRFLDVTFNFARKKCFLSRKANNTPIYINSFSNHPPTIIKQLPKMIKKRISDLSCNKEEFDKVKSIYETALKDSGHFTSMSFNNSNTQNVRKNRNREVIWFNP